MLFLTILEGPSEEEARPVIATGDSRAIIAAVRELSRFAVDETSVETPSPGSRAKNEESKTKQRGEHLNHE